MSAQANFSSTPNLGIVQVSAANSNLDGTGTIATVLTAGDAGSRIDAINLKAVGTTTAGCIRLFIHDGTNTRLLKEMPVQAVTPGASTPSWEAELNTNTMSNILPIILPAGYSLRASTEKAETFNVIATGGNF